MERKAFPVLSEEPSLPKEYVRSFLSKATVLNELMHDASTDYVSEFVEETYPGRRWNSFDLKKFAILDYPMALIETIIKETEIPRLRSILTGFYPIRSGTTINACATISPFGDEVIFFSESLFAFLWDYFHDTAGVLPEGTQAGAATTAQQELIKLKRQSFREKLSRGTYKNWDIDAVVMSNPKTNSPKYDLLFALIFIWAHEMGHIYLKHHDRCAMLPAPRKGQSGDTSVPLLTYNVSQEQECDADMFASDIYFTYLQKGINFPDGAPLRIFVESGLQFFNLLARNEQEQTQTDWRSSTHPATTFRLLNVYLRHRGILQQCGFGDMYDELERGRSKDDKLSQYDYEKNVGTKDVLA